MYVPVLRSDGAEIIVELTPVQLLINGEISFCAYLRDLTDLERSALIPEQKHR